MPVLLEGVVRMPVAYEPWYIYKAQLVAAPKSYEFMDMLFPDSAGKFDRVETDGQVLDIGYAFALEKFTTGDTEVQVAVPGSAIPFIADGVIRPTQLVTLAFAATVQTAAAGLLAEIALGTVMGRMRNHHEDHENLIVAADGDVIIIMTGLI